MTYINLEEICFLFGDESLCKKKCNGHKDGCRSYVRYYPSLNKTYGERPANEKKYTNIPVKIIEGSNKNGDKK